MGDPAEAIRRFAIDQYADLVALGAHHHSMADQLIEGSVAETVLRHAGYSVLVVPAASDEVSDGRAGD